MARVTDCAAARLRTRARDAMMAAGGRGFMRCLPEGGCLFVTDAALRCDAQAILAALRRAGFVCRQEAGGLIVLSPGDALIAGETQVDAPGLRARVDWDGPDMAAHALADRLMRCGRLPLTDDGRQMICETLRCCLLPQQKTGDGIAALRARAAVMLRRGDRSGMAEAGWLLGEYCGVIRRENEINNEAEGTEGLTDED